MCSTSNTFKPHITTAPSFLNKLIYETYQYCIAFQEMKETASAKLNYHYEHGKLFESINVTVLGIFGIQRADIVRLLTVEDITQKVIRSGM